MADDTQTFDQAVEMAAGEARKMMADATEHIAPKPMGVQPVPKTDQHFDFVNRGPDYWQKVLGQAIGQATTSGGNYGDAVIAVLEHDKKMREHRS